MKTIAKNKFEGLNMAPNMLFNMVANTINDDNGHGISVCVRVDVFQLYSLIR